MSLAIPRWAGCRPWQQVPARFSVHVEERGRGLTHHEWIADVPGDPRPAFAERIERRLADLLPTVRNHVYHPDFGGRFSIKKTLPALVPGLSYSDLKVRDGEVATVELQQLF